MFLKFSFFNFYLGFRFGRLFHDFKDSLPSELPPLEDDALRSLTNDEQLVQTFQQQLQLSLQVGTYVTGQQWLSC